MSEELKNVKNEQIYISGYDDADLESYREEGDATFDADFLREPTPASCDYPEESPVDYAEADAPVADNEANSHDEEGVFFSSARIFGKSESEMQAEFKEYKAAKLLKKMSLMLTDPYMPVAEFEGCLSRAIEMGLKGVSVLPNRLSRALKIANERIPVSVCVSFPYAADDFKSKKAALKSVIKKEISAVEIPVVLTDVTEKTASSVAKEYKKLRKTADKKQFVLIADIAGMTPSDMDILALICKNAGIETIKTSCAQKDSKIDDYALNNLKAVLGDRVRIIACSSSNSAQEVVGAFAIGASEYSGTEALSLAEDLRTRIKN